MPKPACLECGSDLVEVWGVSGVFWLHCHACGQDGPDLTDEQLKEATG